MGHVSQTQLKLLNAEQMCCPILLFVSISRVQPEVFSSSNLKFAPMLTDPLVLDKPDARF